MSIYSKLPTPNPTIGVEQKQGSDIKKIQTYEDTVAQKASATSQLKTLPNQPSNSPEIVDLKLNYTSGLTGKIKKEDIDFNAIAISQKNALTGKFIKRNKVNDKVWSKNGEMLNFKEFLNGSVLISSNSIALGWTTKKKLLEQIKKNQQNKAKASSGNLSTSNLVKLGEAISLKLNKPANNPQPILQPQPVQNLQPVQSPQPKKPSIIKQVWSNWRQFSSSWSGIKIGTTTVGSSGCLLTSLAIQLARTGKVPSNFNPGVFVNKIKQKGGISSGGGFKGAWALKSAYSNIIKSAEGYIEISVKKGRAGVANAVKNLISKGNYVVLKVKYKPIGQHWVAVTRVDEKGNIYVVDPAGSTGSGEVILSEKYCKNKKYNIFSQGKIRYYTFKVK